MPQPSDQSLQAECQRLRDQLAATRKDLDVLRAQQKGTAALWVPPGHFMSPIASPEEVKAQEARLFGPPPRTLPAIDLNESGQVELCQKFGALYRDQPWRKDKQQGLRYYFHNPAYAYADGLTLHCMIRHVQPRRIIEIGSGFSSCATLDTNDRFFGGRIDCTFIEPWPERMDEMLNPGERQRLKVIGQRLQDVPLDLFRNLQPNDILFIDSTHVGKIGSDVTYAIHEILPAVAPGVFIHVHDVFHPFEYPREWVYEGRNWNEAYFLRAFLEYNDAFKVEFFTTFVAHFHRPLLAELMPLFLVNTGGSIWLRKLR